MTLTFKILHSKWLPTSITSFRLCITINYLLFRKVKELSSLDEMVSFYGTSSRECPAWSTLSLIFNCVNCTRSSPVNRVFKVWCVKNCWFFHGHILWHFESKKFFVFSICPCWEFIVSKSKSITLISIYFSDFDIFLIEDISSKFIFFWSSIAKTELSNMFNESLINLWVVLLAMKSKISCCFTNRMHYLNFNIKYKIYFYINW